MKNMSDNTKRRLTIMASLAICVALIVLIGSQFIKEKPQDEPLPTPDSQVVDVTVDPAGGPNSNTAKGYDIVVPKPDAQFSQPTDDGGAVSSGTEQTIQPDVTKPQAPKPPKIENEDATVNAPAPPSYKPEQTEQKPSSNNPKNGDKKDGKIYIDGFGWIDDEGGGGSGTEVDGDGDINKQVGIMD
jgi:hypothetical protein